jgi:hypothetical protein
MDRSGRLNLRVKPSLLEQLQLEASTTDQALSSLVRSILVRHVERRGKIVAAGDLANSSESVFDESRYPL